MVYKPLPEHPHRKYEPTNNCCYCGTAADLHDEHIIPFALGGKWIFPNASCADCGKKTGAFEGKCARTILGPLRMMYDVQSRRKNERPDALPLKVRLDPGDEWTTIDVPRDQYPFLILLPLYTLPDELSGLATTGKRDASTDKFWIRGACGKLGMQPHLEALARQLGVAELMPTGETDNEVFCLMLAKIAHSFVSAEIGSDNFEPFLASMVRDLDIENRAQYIGGMQDQEPPSAHLHEVDFDKPGNTPPGTIAIRIRLFACLGTPTYYVAVGHDLQQFLSGSTR